MRSKDEVLQKIIDKQHPYAERGYKPHDYPQVSQIAQKRLSQSQYRQRNA